MNFAEGDWYSPSTVEAFERCPRRWAWRKLEGVKTDKAHLAFGREVHDALKDWLRRGILDPISKAGRVAAQGIWVLPPPQTEGLRVEEWFGVKIGGELFRGIKDLEELDRVPPRVTDHKTTKDLYWAKSPEDLVTDLQACLYAADAMISTGQGRCELRWIYYSTVGAPRSVVVVSRIVSRADIEPTLARAVRAAKKMTRLRLLGARALDMPPNPDSCGDFGGCEYREHCGEVTVSVQTLDDFLASLETRPQPINPPPHEETKTDVAPAPVPEKPARAPRATKVADVVTKTTIVSDDPRATLADLLDAASAFLASCARGLR